MDTGADSNRNLDDDMLLNAGSYPMSYLPMYRRLGIEPKLLIQFPVILPFHLPFRDGTCVTFTFTGAGGCTLCFSTLTSSQGVHAGVVSPEPVEVPVHRSRVEMTYISGDEAGVEESEPGLSQLFDTLLDALNSVIVAYLIVTKDYRVHRVSREMFEFGSLWRVIEPESWTERSRGLFLLHWQFPFEKPELASEVQEKVVWFANVLEKSWNPFILSEELLLSAKREYFAGSYREAVVFAETSVETFLSTLLVNALKAEGVPDAAIEQMLQETAFISRVRKEYHPRFGGSWDISKDRGLTAEWYRGTYELRNRVVHAGYAPSFDETSVALKSAEEMIRYIVDLIKKAPERYDAIRSFLADSSH